MTAVITVAAWLIWGPAPAITYALVAGVSVLIIACPCAMGLATPTSIMVGTGRAAELGVLFRKGDALQGLQSVQTIAFDKTGTLTQGHPALTDIHLASGQTEDDILAQTAAIETASEHPIAKAICDAARDRGLSIPKAQSFESITGMGVRAQVNARTVTIGTARLMDREAIDYSLLAAALDQVTQDGKTPVLIAIDGQIAALLAVSDPIKPEAAKAVQDLIAQGLKVVMITGDNARAARAVADRLNITEVIAEVLPDGKRDAIHALSAKGRTAFVGDGINDAPALASADIGIAIGSGTDIAIEAADVVLVSGTVTAVPTALRVSRATIRNIKQNLFWAFGYNIVLIPVAAAGLLSPPLAAGAMALSSVFVLTNALRLRFLPATH
jgi:Cu+-exporting ATPase